MIRFAHISDLHVCRDPGGTAGLRDDANEVVEALARDLHRIASRLDFVVLSGDLTDDAHIDSFRRVVRLFDTLPCQMFLIPGNHDGPAAFHTCKRDLPFLGESDITGRVVELGGLRIVGVDTCIEGKTTGALTPGDFSLLKRELASGAPAPLIVVMHHAPFPTGSHAFDDISRLEGSADLAAVLHETGATPIILCGHIHRPYSATWNGAACFIAGSPAAPFTSELPFGASPIHPAKEQYTYFLHALGAGGHHVVVPQPLAFPLGT
jgi:3',5'-cyclic AMP phosphodiesterase CpdA